MIVEKFQIYSVKTTVNTFVSQKIESVQFVHALKQSSPPGFYNYLPSRWKLPISPKQHFPKILFPEQKEGGRMYLKKLPKLTRVLVTSFDKFHYLCNLYSIGFVLLCNNLASSILSLT